MSAISALTSNSAGAYAAAGETATPARAVRKTLGQDDFMKLLAVQFQSQDPMKPMEDTAFIAQMAQFTSLDQSTSLVQQMTQLRTNQDIATATSYVGRKVTLAAGDAGPVSGDVSGVDLGNGTPRLMVGGSLYPISAVLRVEPGTPPTVPSTPPTGPQPGGA